MDSNIFRLFCKFFTKYEICVSKKRILFKIRRNFEIFYKIFESVFLSFDIIFQKINNVF